MPGGVDHFHHTCDCKHIVNRHNAFGIKFLLQEEHLEERDTHRALMTDEQRALDDECFSTAIVYQDQDAFIRFLHEALNQRLTQEEEEEQRQQREDAAMRQAPLAAAIMDRIQAQAAEIDALDAILNLADG